jgi:hypothetical protein
LLQAEAEAGDPSPPLISAAAPSASVPFHLAVGYRCPAEMKGTSVMISIADTSGIYDLRDSPAGKVIQVEVPLRQLQWFLPPDQNCVTLAGQRAPDTLDENGMPLFRVGAGSVGYATLTCQGAKGETATATIGTGLDVWLSCPVQTATEPSPLPAGETSLPANSEEGVAPTANDDQPLAPVPEDNSADSSEFRAP